MHFYRQMVTPKCLLVKQSLQILTLEQKGVSISLQVKQVGLIGLRVKKEHYKKMGFQNTPTEGIGKGVCHVFFEGRGINKNIPSICTERRFIHP